MLTLVSSGWVLCLSFDRSNLGWAGGGGLTHMYTAKAQTRLRGYKTFLRSTQLSMKFSLRINVKMPTNVGILTFMSRKNSILGISEPEKFLFA